MHNLTRTTSRWAAARTGARAVTGALVLASALTALHGPAHGATWAFPPPVTAPATSAAGFAHPNLGFTTAQLEYARQQVRADVEPYKSYYAALAASSYANRGLLPTNRSGTPDIPGTPNYNGTTAQTRLINDSWGALTQAVLWYMTGDNVYRHNAMRIVRTWSNMDPARTAYFPDAHIHNGVPLYRLLAAAEILRYTPGDPSYAAYNLLWSPNDTAKLTANLIEPMSTHFFGSNERYLNQHNYSLVGRLAGAIFTDNRARYDETVEWLTVNATSTRPDINGAILPLIPLIEAHNPYNSYGYPFYQIQEMTRDQAHGGDNVDQLAGLLRMVTAQGTKVDPFSGTPSTATDAVSIYRFGGNRVLKGTDAFARFMLGYQTPWADLTGGTAGISEAYRGRLYEVGSLPELYNVYRYEEGVDVEAEAPYVAIANAHANGPTTAWGNKDMGPEAFLTFPHALTGTPMPPQPNGRLEIERKAVFLNGDWAIQSDGGRTYGRAQVQPEGGTVVVHDIVYPNRNVYAPLGLMVRTSGVSRLEIRGREDAAPWWTMTVPDTGGAWRYLVPDSAFAVTTGYRLGDNIAYFRFTGQQGTTVDVDHVNINAAAQLTPPLFQQPVRPATFVTVRGMAYAADFTAKDARVGDTVTYAPVRLPAGATLNGASGTLNWTPAAGQEGIHDIVISATDGESLSVMEAKLNVQPDRRAAFQAAQAGYNPAAVYTTPSLAAFRAEMAPLEQAVDSAPDGEFIANLVKVQAAVKKLELLNPALSDDNSLDWSRMVTVTGFAADAPPRMVDGDYTTFSGDLRAPIYIDFGENYRVAVNAFGFQPRYMFGNRTQGSNVYGSNDNASWTLLTSRETTDTGDRNYIMETIPVVPGQEQERYRYFMVRVDHPGPPTDPAYPGIASYGELRFHGARYDLLVPADVTGAVAIVRSGLTVNRFNQKYTGTVTVTNTSDATVPGPLHLHLQGLPAGVTLDGATGVADGVPYVTLPVSALAAGQSVTLTTTFSNPARTAITYAAQLVSVKY